MSSFSGLTLAQMTGVVKAALPKVKKGFSETQKLNRFVAQREFIANAESQAPIGGEFGWTVRLRSATGSTQALRAYGAVGYAKNYYNERAKAAYVNLTNTAMAFDRIEMAFNSATPEQLYNIVDEAYSAAREDIAVKNESIVFGRRDNASDDTAPSGLQELFPPTCDTSGNFVAEPVGGWNGATIVYGDGSVSSTYANIDAGTIANERHRSWNASHSGIMDESLALLIKRAMDELQFDPIDDLKGDMPADELVLFMDPEFKQQYDAITNRGSDARNGDFFPARKYTLNGTRIVSVTQLRSDTTRSIYGIRKSLVKVIKAKGMWMVEGEGIVPGAHNVKYMPLDYCWAFVNMNRQISGFRINGAF
jgi:hypothetical protein